MPMSAARRNVNVDDSPLSTAPRLATDEGLGIVDVTAANVARLRRVRAQRPRAFHTRRAVVRSQDGVGSYAALHPLLERGERIEAIEPRPSATMLHSWPEEEPEEALHRL